MKRSRRGIIVLMTEFLCFDNAFSFFVLINLKKLALNY